MVSAREIVLSCHGCGKKFRITVYAGVLLDHPLPCPSCKTDILANEKTNSDLKSVFRRSHTPRVVEAQNTVRTVPKTEIKSPRRRFQDVTKVSMDRTGLPPRTDLAKNTTPLTIEPQTPNARLPESTRPKRTNRPNLINPSTKPSIEPQQQKPKAEQRQSNASESTTEFKTQNETRISPNQKGKTEIASTEIVSFNALDFAEGLTIRPAADVRPEGDVRHEGDEAIVFDKEGVKKLIRSRTWLGAFEANFNGKWIALEDHPAIPILEKELKSEAKIAMVSISQEIDREPAKEISSSRSSKLTYIIVLSIFGLSFGGFYFYSFPKPETLPPVVQIPPPQSAIDASFRVQSVAKNIAFSASSFRQKSRDALIGMSDESLAKSNFGDALDILYELQRRDPTDALVVEKLVQSYLGTGSFREARHAIIRLVVLQGTTKKYEQLFEEALRRDPLLKSEIVEIGTQGGLDIDLIKKLGGGKSITFKFKKKGKNIFAFKPSQFEWEDGWESEVAAFIFCEIATCGFIIPRSRRAKISYKNFYRLYPMGTNTQKGYAKRFQNLRWKTENIDGKKVKFLYGVLKDWVPRMVDWPIEYTDLWSSWLDPKIPIQTQSAVFAEMGLLKQKNRTMWKRLRPHMNVPVGLVAGELSSLLSFDFLSNNWDRFSEKEDFYGVNNQFSDGHFLSLDNGAAFGIRHSLRVEKRFENVGRFSRTFFASVQICDSKINSYLFPSQTKNAKKKLDFFHERREIFLKYISTSLKKNEKNNILRFE